MVSFSCENCGDVLTKKKLDPHRNRCHGATFTCIDCMVYFPGNEYRAHTSCMTEEQKYQGALYRPKKQKPNGAEPNHNKTAMSHHAYVEDAPPEYTDIQDFQVHEDNTAPIDMPPKAPTPPPACGGVDLNVFDFLVDSTPNASKTNLHGRNQSVDMTNAPTSGGGRQLVRFDPPEEEYVDPTGYMVDDEDMVQYGPGDPKYFQTPTAKSHRKSKDGSSSKKDKKRKRLHIDTPGPLALTAPGDEEMTDAPPVLHSGLTGGLNRMMRPSQFPPSPDYSGGDGGDQSPVATSPVKKAKHPKGSKTTKSRRTDSFGSNLKALVSGSGRSKVSNKKRKVSSSESKDKKKRRHRSHSHSHSDKSSAPKLIEYRPRSSGDADGEQSNELVVFKPRSDLFLSFCNKGPESDKGCSMNKALKRYHRQRNESGDSLGKLSEEKELFRSLRMRRNDRGEVVLFSIDGDL